MQTALVEDQRFTGWRSFFVSVEKRLKKGCHAFMAPFRLFD
jgi:hypothetical protein